MPSRVKLEEGDYYCSECNVYVGEDSGKCSRCGAEFSGNVDGVRCDSCGKVILASADSCIFCGAKRAAPVEPDKKKTLGMEDEEFLVKLLEWGKKIMIKLLRREDPQPR